MEVLAALLSFQLPVNAPWDAIKDDPSFGPLHTYSSPGWRFWILALSHLASLVCGHLCSSTLATQILGNNSLPGKFYGITGTTLISAMYLSGNSSKVTNQLYLWKAVTFLFPVCFHSPFAHYWLISAPSTQMKCFSLKLPMLKISWAFCTWTAVWTDNKPFFIS